MSEISMKRMLSEYKMDEKRMLKYCMDGDPLEVCDRGMLKYGNV